jgi:hypothetical protein
MKHHIMKTKRDVEEWPHVLLNSPLDGGVLSASRPGLFTPENGVPVTHWIGGRVGPRSGLNVVKRKIAAPAGKQTRVIQLAIYSL